MGEQATLNQEATAWSLEHVMTPGPAGNSTGKASDVALVAFVCQLVSHVTTPDES